MAESQESILSFDVGAVVWKHRAILAAIILVAAAAGMFLASLYVNAHMSGCRLLNADGFEYFPCFHFPTPVGERALSVDDYIFSIRLFLAPLGLICALFLFYPRIPGIVRQLRARWTSAYTLVSLGGASVAIVLFVFYFGNRQFGGFDFSILVDHGWRLVQGQIPYRDFVCTMPPGFFLGAKWAFLIFGVNWDALVFFTALFAAGTFLWMYALLRRIVDSPAAAFFTALAAQGAANLLLCFWGYNNITETTAALFFLSCIAYLKDPQERAIQVSYVASLMLLGLMKPNIAGLVGMLGVGIVVAASAARLRAITLSAAAVALNLLFLIVNHVNPAGLLAGYQDLARGRSGQLLIGFLALRLELVPHTIFFFLALLLPFWIWLDGIRSAIQTRDRAAVGVWLLLLAAPFVSLVGMATNGEFNDVEWPVLICSGVILLFSGHRARLHPLMARLYICCLCGLLVSDLYIGATRFRVRSIGNHSFFEWDEASTSDEVPYFAHLRASDRFWRVLKEIEAARKIYPGTVFFGPRLEFAYSVYRLPSPHHLPVWWDPDTAFARERVPEMEEAWRKNQFQTIIFVKHDAGFINPAFIDELLKRYENDERYRDLTVLHSRVPGGSANPDYREPIAPSLRSSDKK